MRRSILIIYTIILAFLIGNCRTRPVNLVRIPVKSTNAINFIKYKEIVYNPIKVEKFPSEYDPGPSIDYFFLNELPKTITKPISRYQPEEEKNTELKEGDLLLIGGEITLIIKERNVIGEKKGKQRRKFFIKIENWELQLDIFFRDAATGKNIFSKIIKESFNGAEKNKPDYNFEFLFRKITEKFVRLFMGLGRMEVRYLIK